MFHECRVKVWGKHKVGPFDTSTLKRVIKAGKPLAAIWPIQGYPVTHCVVMGKNPTSTSILICEKNQGILTKLLANGAWHKVDVLVTKQLMGESLAVPLMCIFHPQVTAAVPQAAWPALPPQTSGLATQLHKLFREELLLGRKLGSQVSPLQD